jgi:diguanylate cyclase (GGDEF)-like protein
MSDGTFAGVINAAFEYDQLEKFLSSQELDKGGFIALIGLDGVIRARAVDGRLMTEAIGKSLPHANALKLYKQAPSGHYWTIGGVFEQSRRLVTYRVVNGFPLIILAAQIERNIMAQAESTQKVYYGFGGAAATLIVVATAFGISRRRKLTIATGTLKDTNARFSTALAHMSQGLCMVDASLRIVVANERYRELFELPDKLVQPGTNLGKILEYRVAAGKYGGPPLNGDVTAYLSHSDEFQEDLNGRVVLTRCKRTNEEGWLTTHEDITERRKNEEQVLFLAHHDALTGVANRVAFLEKIADASARHRQLGERFNVFVLDLDRFKQVNDTFGHPAGDDVLRQVVDRVKSTMRETDVLARLGGDEFALLQSVENDPRGAAQSLASRIIDVIAEPFVIAGENITVGTSIGIALAPEHGTTSNDLLKMADLALYHTKSKGGNNYAFFDPTFSAAANDQQQVENELRSALTHGQLELHYQPIVDAMTLEVRGAEALIRWRHPQNGLIPPDRFIQVAEACGLITRIGEWVLLAACTEAAGWPSSIKLSVNLSAVQFRSAGLVDHVISALAQSSLPPERLELEITETTLVQNQSECLSIIRQLKAFGISIALDDFGTGYSSLSHLITFPLDKIKIDKSFTQNMTKRSDCAAIISAVLALAQSLNLATTAEGVETDEQLQLLRIAGVSTVQGYLIKKPCPASDLGFGPPAFCQGVGRAA